MDVESMTAYVYFVCMHMITYVSIIYILFMPPNTSNKACYFDLDGILKVLFRLPIRDIWTDYSRLKSQRLKKTQILGWYIIIVD